MKSFLAIALLALAAIAPLAGQGVWIRVGPAASSGPTYAYETAESGNCTAEYGCTVTINTVNGDAVVAVCTHLTGAGNNGCNISDSNGETWTYDATSSNYYGYTSKAYVAFIAHGSAGDVVSFGTSGPIYYTGTVDAYRSSTRWSGVDTSSNMVMASNGGPCSVSFSSASSQANELIFGNCLAAAGTPTTASGYTIDQTNSSTFISGHMAITSIQTPSFTSNGTLTGPQSLVLGLLPN